MTKSFIIPYNYSTKRFEDISPLCLPYIKFAKEDLTKIISELNEILEDAINVEILIFLIALLCFTSNVCIIIYERVFKGNRNEMLNLIIMALFLLLSFGVPYLILKKQIKVTVSRLVDKTQNYNNCTKELQWVVKGPESSNMSFILILEVFEEKITVQENKV